MRRSDDYSNAAGQVTWQYLWLLSRLGLCGPMACWRAGEMMGRLKHRRGEHLTFEYGLILLELGIYDGKQR